MKDVIMQESVFDTLGKSNAKVLSDVRVNQHLRLTCWSNVCDRVAYHADAVHTLSFYMQGGEGSRRLDANHGPGYQGSLCLLPRYNQSVWEITAPIGFGHLYFTDDSLKQFASTTLDIEPRLVQVPELTFHEDKALASLTNELFLMPDNSALSYEQTILQIFHYLLSGAAYCLNAQASFTGGLSPRVLKMVKEYIHQYYDQHVSINTLAKLADLSDFHLLRMFKLSTGFTSNGYLNYVRVGEATKAIVKGNNLVNVANDCGFSNQSHLNRVFKKWMGVTPGQYREAKKVMRCQIV